MGAWGVGPLENDTAQDYLSNVVEGGSLADVEATLDTFLEMDSRLIDIAEAEEALAAVVVVADLARRRFAFYERDGLLHVGYPLQHPEGLLSAIRPKALRVIEIILSDQSALRDQWSGAGLAGEWEACVLALRGEFR